MKTSFLTLLPSFNHLALSLLLGELYSFSSTPALLMSFKYKLMLALPTPPPHWLLYLKSLSLPSVNSTLLPVHFAKTQLPDVASAQQRLWLPFGFSEQGKLFIETANVFYRPNPMDMYNF